MSKKTAHSGDQMSRFKEAARELGCDESEAAFNEKLAKVARASVPRKPVIAAKGPKPQRASKPTPKAPSPAKKKIKFGLSGA
jgi:hypothetical protein